MKRLISDLLDVASIGRGRLSVTPECCRAADLVQEAADLAAGKSIAFHVESAGTATAVAADRGRVIQVLSNLLDNAMKSTPEGGAVTLRAEGVAGGVEFIVRDTGEGIAPAPPLRSVLAGRAGGPPGHRRSPRGPTPGRQRRRAGEHIPLCPADVGSEFCRGSPPVSTGTLAAGLTDVVVGKPV